ncbi:MAG: hypothetical protein Q4C73_07945 [Eubacteriales bacterium]|nr:hypothetical protein [Eubacteriales bacterium]
MKKIRVSCCIMLLAFAMLCLAGCSSKSDRSRETTGGSQTTEAQTSGGSDNGSDRETAGMDKETGGAGMTGGNGGTSTGGAAAEKDGGVIDGLIDDVEEGVEDVTGKTKAAETTKAE